MAAIIAQTNVWSGQVCSGPSIKTLSPLSGGQNANDIIVVRANPPSPSPVHHLDKSAISMLWAFDAHGPAARCPLPGSKRREEMSGFALTLDPSPTQSETEWSALTAHNPNICATIDSSDVHHA